MNGFVWEWVYCPGCFRFALSHCVDVAPDADTHGMGQSGMDTSSEVRPGGWGFLLPSVPVCTINLFCSFIYRDVAHLLESTSHARSHDRFMTPVPPSRSLLTRDSPGHPVLRVLLFSPGDAPCLFSENSGALHVRPRCPARPLSTTADRDGAQSRKRVGNGRSYRMLCIRQLSNGGGGPWHGRQPHACRVKRHEGVEQSAESRPD